MRNVPGLRMVQALPRPSRPTSRRWPRASATTGRVNGRPDKLVMSFHGVPRYTLDAAIPITASARRPARLLAEALALDPEQYLVTFQSRFGACRMAQTLYRWKRMAAVGHARDCGRVDVVCPGFVADCLETLEEIAMENKAAFLSAGGGGVPLHPLPERGRCLDPGACRHCPGQPARLDRRCHADTAQADAAKRQARVGAPWHLARLSSAGSRAVQRVFVPAACPSDLEIRSSPTPCPPS